MDFKTIPTYCREAHENAKAKGFYDNEVQVGTNLMMIVEELSEALGAHRKNRFANMHTFENIQKCDPDFKNNFLLYIKDTFQDEIADVFIRLFDFCGKMEIDIEKFIQLKMMFNKNRLTRHGKEY